MNNECLIGVDLGGTNVRCGLVEGLTLVKTVNNKISSNGTKSTVVAEVIESISALINKNVKAIGIGVPGIVDTKKGIIYDVQNIRSWKEVHLKTILENYFKIPVYLNNDANCFAVGEWYYGKGKGFTNVAALILGTGVAAGLICNNKLYEGRNCGAGEFGMLPYLNHNYEFYCSGNYFNHFHQLSGEQVYQQAKDGKDTALQIFNEYGKHLSAVVKAVLYTIDPEIIILGGSVSKSFQFFSESLFYHLNNFAYQPVIRHIKIEPSDQEHIAILGAAALYFNT